MSLKSWRLVVTLAVAVIVLLVGAATMAQIAPPPAASAPLQVTPGTECGAPGVGRLVGRAEPVARGASEAAGMYVNAEGYWATPCPLKATPNTACGAPGVGRMPGFGMLAKDNANAADGWRVDADGVWQRCNQPCPPEPGEHEAFRVWAQDGRVCTTYDRYATSADDPARNRTLRHGELGVWRQWLGGKRGQLHEQCTDGKRAVTLSTCAPATHCDQRWIDVETGAVYDARHEASRVPLGSYAEAVAPGGARLRIQCVAGDWMATPQCQPGQEVTRTYTWQRRVYRYSGPPVDVGARVRAEQVYALDTRSGASEPGANRIRWTVATCGPGGVLR